MRLLRTIKVLVVDTEASDGSFYGPATDSRTEETDADAPFFTRESSAAFVMAADEEFRVPFGSVGDVVFSAAALYLSASKDVSIVLTKGDDEITLDLIAGGDGNAVFYIEANVGSCVVTASEADTKLTYAVLGASA